MSRRKKLLALVALLGLVGISVVVGVFVGEGESQAIIVEAKQLARKPFQVTVTGSGIVEGIHNKEVRSHLNGRISHLFVEEGDFVSVGEVVAQLDDRELQTQLIAAQASLASVEVEVAQLQADVNWTDVADSFDVRQARSQLEQAKARLIEAQKGPAMAQVKQGQSTVEESKLNLNQTIDHFQRMERLYNQQAVTRQQYQDALHAVQVAENRYANAQLQLESLFEESIQVTVYQGQVYDNELQLLQATQRAQSRLDSLRAAKVRLAQAQDHVAAIMQQLERIHIQSDFRGVVSRSYATVGSFVTGGSPIIELADLSSKVVKAPIDEVDIPQIHVGQKVRITSDALVNQQVEGQVTRIATQPLYEGKVAKYVVTIELVDPPESLRPGMNADVEVIIISRESIAIPIQALQNVSQDEQAVTTTIHGIQQKVFLIRNDVIVEVPVIVGEMSLTDAEVIEGLEPGDLVVTGKYAVLRQLKAGDHVKVQ